MDGSEEYFATNRIERNIEREKIFRANLIELLKRYGIREVIMMLNPSGEGDEVEIVLSCDHFKSRWTNGDWAKEGF